MLTVTPYRWARPAARERLPRLIKAACRHQLDAVTFTSAPAASALLETADSLGLRADLVRAMSEHVAAVAIGPVTAAPLRAAGITPAMPDRFRLGALIRLVSEELVERHVRRFRCGADRDRAARAQRLGRRRHVTLGPNALILFTALASSDSVVSRHELVGRLPDELDDHALEVAMSRLRRSWAYRG